MQRLNIYKIDNFSLSGVYEIFFIITAKLNKQENFKILYIYIYIYHKISHTFARFQGTRY